jgi:hypothetical protein
MIYGIEKEPHLGGYIVRLTDHGDPNTYATEVWDWMVQDGVRSVIDVGCGEGHSTSYLLAKGVDALGIEGGENAYNNSPVREHLVLHDYTKGPFVTDRPYDAVWSCEFVEHVEERYAENFLATFDCANRVFMTHAVPGQEGYHHVNCRTADYWIGTMERRGFRYGHEKSLSLRKMTDKMHVRNTLLVFEKECLGA